jgi:hypothetical protein
LQRAGKEVIERLGTGNMHDMAIERMLPRTAGHPICFFFCDPCSLLSVGGLFMLRCPILLQLAKDVDSI